jgi:hypothetical protein
MAESKELIVFGVILFLFFASFATLFGVSIYELTKKNNEEQLLFIGEESTQLQVTTEWTTLYTFYTKNVNETLQKYKGQYVVIMDNSSGVNFRVVDENDNVIGSTVDRKGAYIGSSIPFNSGDKEISQIILQYTSNQNAIVARVEIELF